MWTVCSFSSQSRVPRHSWTTAGSPRTCYRTFRPFPVWEGDRRSCDEWSCSGFRVNLRFRISGIDAQESMEIACQLLQETARLFPKVAARSYVLSGHLPASSSAFGMGTVSYFSHSDRWAAISSWPFNLHFPDGSQSRASFRALVRHRCLPFAEKTVPIFRPLCFFLTKFNELKNSVLLLKKQAADISARETRSLQNS